MAGLMNTVARLAGTASASRRRGTGAPAAGGMSRRGTGVGGPTTSGTAGAAGAAGLLSRFMKRR